MSQFRVKSSPTLRRNEVIRFTSYPGLLHSYDDFYTLSGAGETQSNTWTKLGSTERTPRVGWCRESHRHLDIDGHLRHRSIRPDFPDWVGRTVLLLPSALLLLHSVSTLRYRHVFPASLPSTDQLSTPTGSSSVSCPWLHRAPLFAALPRLSFMTAQTASVCSPGLPQWLRTTASNRLASSARHWAALHGRYVAPGTV